MHFRTTIPTGFTSATSLRKSVFAAGICALLALSSPVSLVAQPAAPSAPVERATPQQYIQQWGEIAVREMVQHGIPASITLAQGILESGNGNSELARASNNHFGIKCHGTWNGRKTYHDDDAAGECFRVYDDPADSYADHSAFLKKPRYSGLFALEVTDYKGWAHGLKSAGYATHPSYAQMLIDIIERNDLATFDARGLELMGRHDATAWAGTQRTDEPNLAGSDRFRPAGTIGRDRELRLSGNRVLFIVAKAGDTFEDLAYELDMMPWQFYRYNDVERKKGLAHRVEPGEVIYLQPKRDHAATDWHVVAPGETIRDIAQRYGVKLQSLISLNLLQPGEAPKPGDLLSLRWQMAEGGRLHWTARLRGAQLPDEPDVPDLR